MSQILLLQLQDYSRNPSAESEVKFQLSRISLEPMLRSMAYISEQLSTPVNKVAVINLKVREFLCVFHSNLTIPKLCCFLVLPLRKLRFVHLGTFLISKFLEQLSSLLALRGGGFLHMLIFSF